MLAGSPAHAVLGGPVGTVETDRIHMAAKAASSSAATHTVHALTLANGEVIREFARADGTVFAISWHGPSRPDLRQLLGSRFDTLQADNALPGGRRTRRPLAVHRTDFVLVTAGHPGGFRGFAYLPNVTPTGFSFQELR